MREIPWSEVAVGDIVLLSSGEWIPADGFLLDGEIRTDQSAMTGEGREIRKIPQPTKNLTPSAPNAVFRGCTVTSGSCEMEVAAVGDSSFLGGISREIQSEQRDSPLKIRLSKLARQISVLGYLAAGVVALVSFFHAALSLGGGDWRVALSCLSDLPVLLGLLFRALTLGLTVIVVAVPEGLPMMIAVVLSSNVRKMARDQVLVRRASGIEAAGSMNILFTDKTGTLTEGKMTATALLLPDGGTAPFSEGMQNGGEIARRMLLGIRYGTETTLGVAENGETAPLGGSSTERALTEAILPFLPKEETARRAGFLPFDSRNKFSAVTLTEGGGRVTYLLGAPERLLPRATGALAREGRIVRLSRSVVEKQIRGQTTQGGRVLALAIADGDVPVSRLRDGIPPTVSLCYVGAILLRDELRKTAGDAVADLQNAGVAVVMVTGDNRETACGIARRCGILGGLRDTVLTGDELAALSDREATALLPRLAVVARALPRDKSRLVRLSQEAGLVVGMTGDGINDAPALRRADVGFAMGGGTQVAKDAGDVIILDNRLESVVRAVLYGRTVFKSIRKFITLQLTMNFCAVAVTVIAPFLGVESPVTVVQMLWINLIMDTLGGLAFAGEAALPSYMREPPKRRDEAILNRYMVNEILVHGSFTVALLLFFLKSPWIASFFRPSQDDVCLLTAFFALFIFSSVFNCFNARTDRLNLAAGMRKNPIFLCIMGAVLVVQLLFVYLGGEVLRTVPLTLRELVLTMDLSLAVVPADLLRKFLRKRFRRDGY